MLKLNKKGPFHDVTKISVEIQAQQGSDRLHKAKGGSDEDRSARPGPDRRVGSEDQIHKEPKGR